MEKTTEEEFKLIFVYVFSIEQIASKKFLGDLSDLATNKKTESAVVAMILRVLSPLAFEYQVSLAPLNFYHSQLIFLRRLLV